MSRGDSIRQKVSIARWASDARTGDQSIPRAAAQTAPPGLPGDVTEPKPRPWALLLARGLGAHALFLLAELGRERLAEVVGFEDLADFDL